MALSKSNNNKLSSPSPCPNLPESSFHTPHKSPPLPMPMSIPIKQPDHNKPRNNNNTTTTTTTTTPVVTDLHHMHSGATDERSLLSTRSSTKTNVDVYNVGIVGGSHNTRTRRDQLDNLIDGFHSFPTTPYPHKHAKQKLFTSPNPNPSSSWTPFTSPLPSPSPQTTRGLPESPSDVALKAILHDKEQEVRDLHELRLQQALEDKQKIEQELSENKIRQDKMKGDFEYNLKLLEERDAELETYDHMFSEYPKVLRERDEEINDLKEKIADLEKRCEKERQSFHRHQERWKQQNEQQLQKLSNVQRQNLNALQTQKEEFEQTKMEFRTKLLEKDQESSSQKQAVKAHYENVLRDRKSEFLLEKESLLNSIAMSKSSVEKLQNEIISLKRDLKQQINKTETSIQSISKFEKASQKSSLKNQQLKKDQKDQKDQITRRDEQIKHLVREKQTIIEECEMKVKELSETLRVVVNEKEQHYQKVKKLVESHHQEQLDNYKERSDFNLIQKNKNDEISALRKDKSDVEQKLKHEVCEKIAELASIKKKNEILKQTIEDRKIDIDRYKQELIDLEVRYQNEQKRQSISQNLNHQNTLKIQNSKIQSKSEEIRSLTKQRDDLKQQLLNTQKKVNDLREKLPTKADIPHGSSLSFQLTSVLKENSELKKQLVEFEEQRTKSQTIIENMRQDLEEVRNKKLQEKTRLESSIIQLSQANLQLQNLVDELSFPSTVINVPLNQHSQQTKHPQIHELKDSAVSKISNFPPNQLSFDCRDETSNNNSLLLQENQSLKTQLKGADLQREKLIEISNKLKSDLSKSRRSPKAFHKSYQSEFPSVINNTYCSKASDFDHQTDNSDFSSSSRSVSQIDNENDLNILSTKSQNSDHQTEGAFQQLSLQNKTLKMRLQKLISNPTEEEECPSLQFHHTLASLQSREAQESLCEHLSQLSSPLSGALSGGISLSRGGSESDEIERDSHVINNRHSLFAQNRFKLRRLDAQREAEGNDIFSFAEFDENHFEVGNIRTERTNEDVETSFYSSISDTTVSREESSEINREKSINTENDERNEKKRNPDSADNCHSESCALSVTGEAISGSARQRNSLISDRATKSQVDVADRMKQLQNKRNQRMPLHCALRLNYFQQ